MSTSKTSSKTIGAGIAAAIVASLCCITPVLAFVAGISGFAATFSWLEPFRPYLIALTIGVLGFAWYQQLKPRKQDIDCDCEDEKGKTGFLHSKLFLGIVTVVAISMLAFPNYAHIFYPQAQKAEVIAADNVKLVEFEVKGMTCTGCEQHVSYEVNKLPGVIATQVSYKNANALVKYDPSLLDENDIKAAISSTGYKVVASHEKDPSEVVSDQNTMQSTIK